MKSIGYHPFPPSTEEAWGYVKDVIEITRRHPEYRRSGTKGDVDEFATTANVMGVLPGLTDDVIMITTHHDTGWEGVLGRT